MTTVTPWCDDHEPRQYRNGLPARCDKCGFDANGRAWIHRPGTFKPLVAYLADGVEPTQADLDDIALATEVIREHNARAAEAAIRESGGSSGGITDESRGLIQHHSRGSWGRS